MFEIQGWVSSTNNPSQKSVSTLSQYHFGSGCLEIEVKISKYRVLKIGVVGVSSKILKNIT